MKEKILDSWQVALVPHSRVIKDPFYARTEQEIRAGGYTIVDATVPGCMELDLMRAGMLDDLYYGANILQAQRLESTHLWYFSRFWLEEHEQDAFLCFEGIDTAAEIFIDGILLGKTENMLISYEFSLDGIMPGEHELVVHIIPAGVYSRTLTIPPHCRSQRYHLDSVAVRKAPYMYGWDIMPRTVSAGLWRPVKLVYKPKSRIKEVFLWTVNIEEESADLKCFLRVQTEEDFLQDFTVAVEGKCGEASFFAQRKLFGSAEILDLRAERVRLWWPKNYGEPNLYEVKVTLFFRGKECDTRTFAFGVRTVALDRTSLAGKDGRFGFLINGKKIFVLGTNWVPVDAFPARHEEYTPRGLALALDLGCNMIRCWGGNVYPHEEFFDFCDAHGILVWQDFAMACASYPEDERFLHLLAQEVEQIVCRLRNHSSLVLWSGDNECDQFALWNRIVWNGQTLHRADPNKNLLTRGLLPHIVEMFDGTRPYLPSSPYMDETAVCGGNPSEDHLWGPRDFFKGDYYKNSVCHFASETGYHGCPAPETLRQFLSGESLKNMGDGKKCEDPQWLLHASNPEGDSKAPFAYRIPLMIRQVERLFGSAADSLSDFALQSQISQAEADKFFIEKFRAEKGYRTGILWWNVIDGWPQISDAVVDWYGRKKLAYSYIKRSQQPFCLLCGEPENGMISLFAVNDTQQTVAAEYTVREVLHDQVLLSGNCSIPPNESMSIGVLPEKKAFYLMQWNGSAGCGCNHFIPEMEKGLSFDEYRMFLNITGFFEELEGF